MKLMTRNGNFGPSPLDRLRAGTDGSLTALPAQATVRPSLVETLFASRGERQIMRQRETAAATIEVAQIDAAVEVAIARTQDIKGVTLKGLQAETARVHAELEDQMQKDNHDADSNDAKVVNRLATDTVHAEKAVLDAVNALVESGGIAPDRAQLLTEIVRSNTDRVLGSAVDLCDMIHDSRTERLNRALSRKR